MTETVAELAFARGPIALLKGAVTRYLLPAAGIAVLVLAALAGVQTVRLASAQADVAKVRALWAAQRADQERTARLANDNYRQREHELQDQLIEANHALRVEKERGVAAAAAQRAADDRLRKSIAAYAGGGGEPAAPACAAERERAEALGVGLADALPVQDDLAAAFEAANSDVRALLAAWPRDQPGPVTVNSSP